MPNSPSSATTASPSPHRNLIRYKGRSGAAYRNASRFLARDPAEVADDISGAARFLLDHPLVKGDNVCVAGDAGGGALALWAATISPRIGAAGAFYPARFLWRFEGIRPEALAGCR